MKLWHIQKELLLLIMSFLEKFLDTGAFYFNDMNNLVIIIQSISQNKKTELHLVNNRKKNSENLSMD